MVAVTLLTMTIVLLGVNLAGLASVPWLVVVAPLAALVALSLIGWVARYIITRRLEKQLNAELRTLLGGLSGPDRMEGGYL